MTMAVSRLVLRSRCGHWRSATDYTGTSKLRLMELFTFRTNPAVANRESLFRRTTVCRGPFALSRGVTSGDTDPSVGIGADGTVYFGYADGDGHARVAVSHNRGATWEHVQDVGAAQGVQNTVFPAVIAGDSNRAAYFFLGSTTPGANGRATDRSFPGTWYGYIATTYDGGASWVTANATPNDPVQRGVVCTSGTTCPDGTRNLLDFNDLTVDKQGRVLAAYADGCVTADCIRGVDRNGDGRLDSNDNDGTDKATIIRQTGGKRLFAAFDPPVNARPEPPLLVGDERR